MRVGVLGCGYVGLELGRQLAADGHDVVGVRRSESGAAAVADAGLTPVRADVTDAASLSSVPDVDALVYAVSSDGRGAAAAQRAYVTGLETAVDHFGGRDSPPDRLVYTSSTGVYGDHEGGWVDEETPVSPADERAAALVAAEETARSRSAAAGMDTTVVRLAGLYGPGRYRLDRYLTGPVTEGYLNLVHRTDAAGAIRFLLSRRPAPDVVLAVDDEPVSKWKFADWLAGQCGAEAPPKRTVAQRLATEDLPADRERRIAAAKRCSNDRLRSLGYEFSVSTFREGYAPAVERYLAGDDLQ